MLNIVKNTTFPSLLDLLAPHSCRGCGRTGHALCNRCKNDIILSHVNHCPNCKASSPTGQCQKCKSLPPIFTVGDRTDLINTLIHDFKYNSTHTLAKPLADILHNILPTFEGPTVIVPLPTIDRHIRERGLDHTYLIAKHLTKLRHYQVQKLLIRYHDTVQVGADRKTRLTQAKSAYILNPKPTIDLDATYILFDDVWTTGASIKAAIKILQKAGIQKIVVAILAVSRLDQK